MPGLFFPVLRLWRARLHPRRLAFLVPSGRCPQCASGWRSTPRSGHRASQTLACPPGDIDSPTALRPGCWGLCPRVEGHTQSWQCQAWWQKTGGSKGRGWRLRFPPSRAGKAVLKPGDHRAEGRLSGRGHVLSATGQQVQGPRGGLEEPEDGSESAGRASEHPGPGTGAHVRRKLLTSMTLPSARKWTLFTHVSVLLVTPNKGNYLLSYTLNSFSPLKVKIA